MIRTYSELITIPTFRERYEYLKLTGVVGESTFGYDRYLNQLLYRSQEWRALRNKIIIRDNACDLAHEDYSIHDMVVVHHIVPITEDDILNDHPRIYDPENLICTSDRTHKAIHYSDASLIIQDHIDRYPGDTTLW